MADNTVFGNVPSDVSPALLPLASQQAVAVATTVTSSTVDRGTTFPASPTDKDEYHYVADSASGIVWRFKYNAGSASSYKWEFIGGLPLFAEVAAGEGTTSATYAALATPGPAILLPLTGDYDVAIGCTMTDGTNGAETRMSYDIGGTGAVDADSFRALQAGGANSIYIPAARPRRKTGLTAITLTAKYKASAGTGTFENRWMSVLPVRVIG